MQMVVCVCFSYFLKSFRYFILFLTPPPPPNQRFVTVSITSRYCFCFHPIFRICQIPILLWSWVTIPHSLFILFGCLIITDNHRRYDRVRRPSYHPYLWSTSRRRPIAILDKFHPIPSNLPIAVFRPHSVE